MALKYVSDRLKKDRNIVLLAISNPKAFTKFNLLQCGNWFVEGIKENRNIEDLNIKQLSQINIDVLKYTSDRLKNDKEITYEAVKKNSLTFELTT